MRSPSPLAKLRKDSGFTQKEMAEKLGVGRDTVSRWESGDIAPNLRTFMKLGFLLGVDFQTLGLALLHGPRRQRREDLPQPPKDWVRDCSRDRPNPTSPDRPEP